MWIVTDSKSNIVAQVEPTKGIRNLGYQLKQLGLMADYKQLVGLGTYRRILNEKGEVQYNVVKLPYVPVAMRKKGGGVLFQPIDITPADAENSDKDAVGH